MPIGLVISPLEKDKKKRGKRREKSGKANKEKTETFGNSLKCRVKSYLYCRRLGRQGLDLLASPPQLLGSHTLQGT